MNNWKEQFDIEFGGVLVPGYKPDGYVDYSRVEKFIETEIIEKLIEEIPSKCTWCLCDKNGELKHQLRERWLSQGGGK